MLYWGFYETCDREATTTRGCHLGYTDTLMDRFGPDNFSTLQIKGHVLHRARAHLKVPVF